MRLAAVGLAVLVLVGGCGTAPPAGADPVWSDPASAAPSPLPPSPSASPSAAPPSPAALPAGVTAAVAVYDRQTGTFTEQRQLTLRFRSASLVKLLIALDYLWNRGPAYAVPAADRPRLD